MTSFFGIVTCVGLFTVLLADAQEQLVPPQPPACNATMACSAGQVCLTMTGCSLGTCACQQGWRADTSAVNFTCVRATQTVGMNCTSNAECMGSVTYCMTSLTSGQQQCACSSIYYIPTPDGTDCTPQPLGANCTHWNSTRDPFCGNNAVCDTISGRCECSGSFKPQDNYTCTSLAQGDVCNATRDCVNYNDCPYAACVNGTYRCNTGYMWSVTSSSIGGLCVPDNATLNLGEGEACDRQGPYRRVCGSDLTCGLCPENSDTAAYTCVGAAAQQQLNITDNRTTATTSPSNTTALPIVDNNSTTVTTSPSNTTTLPTVDNNSTMIPLNSTDQPNSALMTLPSSTCTVVVMLCSLLVMFL